ncbi:hexon [Tasmannia lanceolata]|uniref:hexon n=1 Tax=Tasmannia lanceolata TaxID=3420 RepID=UPI004062B46A
MVQTLEAIKDAGWSIKVGTTGTIGSLMTRELKSLKHAPLPSVPTRRKPQTSSVSVPCGSTALKKSKPRRKSFDEGSSNNRTVNRRSPANTQRTRANLQKSDHHIAMLSSDNIPTEES